MKILAMLVLLLSAGAAAAGGCCSHHGGVKDCNEKSGMLMCEDRTVSEHCTCKDWRENHSKTADRKAAAESPKKKPLVK